jgi:hypothetical protein
MSDVAAAGWGAATAAVPLRTVAATGTNVHGLIRRPAPGAVSLLLTAHYDGVGDDPQLHLPAASDNASGVAVVLPPREQLAAAAGPRRRRRLPAGDWPPESAVGCGRHR